MSSPIFRIAALALCVLAVAAACADSPSPSGAVVSAVETPTPIRAPMATPIPTHAPAPTPVPTNTPAPTRTPVPTNTPAPTATPIPTNTPVPTRAAPEYYEFAPPFPPDSRLRQIALGYDYVCGLNEDGRAVCLEDLSGATYWASAFSAISSGRHFACGLRRDGGALSCWGDSKYGETDPPEGSFSSLSAGKRHACALNADGEAVCWGWDKDDRATPPADGRFIAIAAGETHSCAIAEFGNLVCWGQSEQGGAERNDGPFSALAVGLRHACALRPDGAAFCQGKDDYGQASPPNAVFSRIDAGGNQTCGITPQGDLECWGLMSISGLPEKFASVSVGYREVCALTVDGAAKCWFDSPPTQNPLNAILNHPMEMFPMPSGGAAVVNQEGYIKIYPPDGGEPRIALDLTERTACCFGERGMLSAALDPEFDRFPFIYIYWQTDADDADPDGDLVEGRVSRFPIMDDGTAVVDDELAILRIPQSEKGHSGGAIRFGPDGMLYLGLGDQLPFQHGTSYLADEFDGAYPSSDLSTLLGKIIRIDVRGATESEPYRVPPDNPFADAPGARPEIWAYGLRNPWRMSFMPDGALIVADLGQHEREELSIAAAGDDLGWPLFEGGLCFAEPERLCDDAEEGVKFPIFEYSHDDGDCAIIGGMAAANGDYIFGDWCSGRVWALARTAPDVWQATEIMQAPAPLLAFGSDADGAVYALSYRAPATRVSE